MSPAERTLLSSAAQTEETSLLLGKLPVRGTREPSVLPQLSPSPEPPRVMATQEEPAPLLAQAGRTLGERVETHPSTVRRFWLFARLRRKMMAQHLL